MALAQTSCRWKSLQTSTDTMQNCCVMSIPDYQSLMLPLLKRVADGQEHTFPSLVEALAADFKLSEPERRELLPSGGHSYLTIAWGGLGPI